MDTGTELRPAAGAPLPQQQQPASARRPRGMRKWMAAALATALAAAMSWAIFAPAPLPLELAPVTRGPLLVTVDNQGQIRAHDKYVVAAPVGAELERVALHDGDPVAKGQTVAVLNPMPIDLRQRQEAAAGLDSAKALAREAGLQVQRADTDLRFAISERQRAQRLVHSNYMSPQTLEKALAAERSARAAWEAAKSREQAAIADIRSAEAALFAVSATDAGGTRQVRLAAPVDGYALKVHEKSARTVAAGTPLVTIGDPSRYEVVVDVLSTDAVKIRPGNLMLLEGWGGGKVLRAKVRVVEPVAFTKISALGVEEQRVNIIGDPIDALGVLGDGYRVEARIVIWSAKDVIKVPGSSLFRAGDAWHVFVVEDGRAREREVEIGRRNQDEAQVTRGLAARETVVRFPANQIRSGMRVAPSGQ